MGCPTNNAKISRLALRLSLIFVAFFCYGKNLGFLHFLQSFVRLIAFNQIYKVLGMERLSADAFNGVSSNQQRKRTLDDADVGADGIEEGLFKNGFLPSNC